MKTPGDVTACRRAVKLLTEELLLSFSPQTIVRLHDNRKYAISIFHSQKTRFTISASHGLSIRYPWGERVLFL